MSADQSPDDLRASDIEHRFARTACGQRGADVRLVPNVNAGWHHDRANLVARKRAYAARDLLFPDRATVGLLTGFVVADTGCLLGLAAVSVELSDVARISR